ncbi:hypothetical protein ACJ5H2_12330 [Nocardioides sp. R1-1]|uniref:hypothetical protein n=1 Tax=Nocardioides sp. R1-1 TaxID=3383502 RepID=UPI0038D1DA22
MRDDARMAPLAIGGLLFVVMAGTTLPNALWGWYQARWNVPATAVTAAFATYAVAVVASLLTWGSLADRRGPWPSLRRGVLCSAAASALSLVEGLPALFAGRTLAGLSVGLVSSAAVGALALAHRSGPDGAARVSTFATMAGLAAGPLLAGAVVDVSPAAARGAYLAHLLLLAPVVAWLASPHGRPARMPVGDVRPRDTPRHSVAMPRTPAFRAACLLGFASNAQLGLYAALASTMLSAIHGEVSVLLSGLAGALLFAAAGAPQLLGGSFAAGSAWSTAASSTGVVSCVTALTLDSVPLLLAAIALGGLGAGLAFGRGLFAATENAPVQERAAVSTTWFVAAYLGLAGPVLGAGALVDAVGLVAATAIVGTATTFLVTAAQTTLAPFRVNHRAARLSGRVHRKDNSWTS